MCARVSMLFLVLMDRYAGELSRGEMFSEDLRVGAMVASGKLRAHGVVNSLTTKLFSNSARRGLSITHRLTFQ